MKKRITTVANFFAFNLLFFALYLNFIHKDQNVVNTVTQTAPAVQQGTVLVEHPEQYLKAQGAQSPKAVAQHEPQDRTTALKLSIN